MGKVLYIAISKNFKDRMHSIENVEVIAGHGLVNDRHFKKKNNERCQITLIEIENVKYYNEISKTSILPIDFRRNLVTEGVKLNALVDKEFLIGNVKVKAHDLCQPCKELQDNLNQINLVKKLLNRGGLRCEILTDGKISVGDKIKY